MLIDPADVEYPASLNLFDAHLERTERYGPADRERVLNGVVELYETFFGDLLGAELTQKQGVIFKYLARLMLSMEGATIHTLMQLMDRGLEVAIYTRSDVRTCFASVGARTREEIAEAVARHIDAFQDRLPKRRRCWEPEDYRLALFSAAALVATHYQRGSSRLLDQLGDHSL